ncbi:MAG: MBL fold metallo-hydrolase [Deltaproteobacteria bacterium]|nr:MAG: MBL fold metallo-hydrolase [Deltaproteobacteria bacterium]
MIKETENLYQLSDSTYMFIVPIYEDLGNAGIVKTDEGVVVIDTDVRTVDQFFATLPQITDKPVKFLINSHHAFDHTSANCVFAQKGVTIIGSERCRQEMIRYGEHNFKRWSDREPYVKKILEEKAITVALPHITFDHELQLHLGGETLELFYYGHAHTPGDIIIYLPKDQILFAGDLLWVGFFPNVREANVPNQVRVLDRILEFPVKYYIPGHGNITSDRGEVIRLRNFLEFLYERINDMVRDGQSLEEVRTLEDSLGREHPDWQGRKFLTRAIEVIYQSLADQSR